MTGGLAAAAGGVVAVGAVMTGAGWLLAVALGDRSDLRSVSTKSGFENRWDAAALDGAGAPGTTVVAENTPPAPRRPFRTPVLDPIGGLALIVPKSRPVLAAVSADSIKTGSLGPRLVKLEPIRRAPTRVASADPAVLPVPSITAPIVARATPMPPPLPLPRARPQLASLTPMEGLTPKTDDDGRMRKTAIYDITAQTVYLPSGARLEAHSGLGDLMDDPRHARERNRGVTPPNTYQLTLRESLFHGVQAIRLTPVGDGEMYGRDGILAHSFMLGPSGQSNGCVSFRDYHKFLQAFQRGEIDRMVVVSRLDKAPTAVASSAVPHRVDNMF